MRLAAFLGCFLVTAGLAQNQPILQGQNIHFDQLSLRDGLSQTTVLCSWQDHLGFMWFGTRDGLNRYDGYSINIYRTDINDPTSLASNVISSIQEDKNGDLWMVTDRGLSKFIRASSKFENHPLPEAYIGRTKLYALCIDSNQNIWVGGAAGLFLFNPHTNSYNHVATQNQSETDLVEHPVYALHEDSQNHRLWVGTSRDGVYTIDIKTLTVIGKQKFQNKPKARIHSIVSLNQGDSIWAASYGDGLFLINKDGELLDHYHAQHPDPNKRIAHNNIRALQIDNYGNLWVGTFNGLDLLSSQLELQHITYQEGKKNGLSHGSVRSIFKDSKGSLWIGTYFAGVNILDFDNQRFNHFYHMPGQAGSLTFNVVGSFSEDVKSNLIIGTERGGVNIYDKKLKSHYSFLHVANDPSSLSGNIIKSIYTDKVGNTWVGVFKGGLNLLSIQDGKARKFLGNDSRQDELSTAIINDIVEGKEGNLWIATDQLGGLHCFNPQQGKYVDYPGSDSIKHIIGNYSAKDILIDRNNLFWLATHGSGVIKLNPVNGEVRQLRQFNVTDGNVTIDEANHIHEDDQGNLWISSNGYGLVKYDPKSKKSRHYYTAQGLSNDVVLGCLQDNAKQLWFFTLNGPNLLSESEVEFKSYPYNSGFPIEEINEGAFFKTRSGDFVVGGSNGYTRFTPDRLTDNGFVPPIVFTNLKISNKEVLPGDEEKILSTSISKTEKITLTYYQSVVTFEFTALSYLRPENNQYAYMLEGFDEDWNFVNDKRSVTFTNLPEGDYTLHVKGSNNDGVWNEKATTLVITVLPPPWKTWWAYIIYGSVIVSGFLIIRYNALKGIQLKHDLKLEQLEKEKWKDIHQLKLEYFTDVSHEFRTPLTLITNPLEEIMESGKAGKWMRKRLKIMYLNCKRLLHLIDQILEIRELETGHSKLKMTPVRVESFLGNIIDSFKTIADKKHIHLIYSPTHTDMVYLTDMDKIEKIFFNLLSNSFKFTKAGGEILLKFGIENGKGTDTVHFEVTDTGSGIAKEQLDKIFDRFYKQGEDGSGAGIGLSLTKSLVNLLEGEINVTSKLNEGTTFYIDIPMERAKVKSPVKTTKQFLKPLPLEYQAILSGDKKSMNDRLHLKQSILIVEDNLELRTYLEEHLGKSYQTITAANGVRGLQQARKHGPSLIVSDIMMDEMDGMELCKTIKTDSELCHIPIILLTAKSSHVNRLEGLELGADDYIHKPFIMRELETRIRNILDNRKRLRDKYKSTSYLPSADEITFNSYDEKLLKRIVNTIQSNLSESKLTVEFLAHEIGLSRVQLFRKLKSLTGLSPADYIKDFRMKRAAHLLREKNVKVAEVAYEVGFQDVQYFSKCFKKAYKVSPKEFIKERGEIGELN